MLLFPCRRYVGMAVLFSGLILRQYRLMLGFICILPRPGLKKQGMPGRYTPIVLLAPFEEERGQNAQDEDQERGEKTISPDRQW